MDQPVFSIIIPARNADRFVAETLDSVCAQSLGAFEVKCIDDGSTDGTRDILDRYAQRDARFQAVQGPAKGVSAARNLGLTWAKTPFVLFLDADDLLHTEALQTYYDTLTGSFAVGAVAGVQRMDIDGHPMRGSDNRTLIPAQDQLDALLCKNFVVNGGALALRTDIARQAGGYDENLIKGEDWEFWCRVALLGPFAVVVGPPLLQYRQVASGANHQARGSVFARGVPSLQKVAANPAMREKYGPRLRHLLRARQIDIFWSGVRNQYQYGRKSTALFEGLCGAALYPDSLFRPKLIWRFLQSLDRSAKQGTVGPGKPEGRH
ncbi:glycosyltransferase family 2 protein [Ruegeria arenilitoris]|uniref:glycosyltransferase family 2 protein n=1 Tax=Ruegeria arenilitoris TaxID=1173585 RepID=UPI00147FB1C8|nr:glycosyltransferase family A protein [Ruegeria arenilitoris]